MYNLSRKELLEINGGALCACPTYYSFMRFYKFIIKQIRK